MTLLLAILLVIAVLTAPAIAAAVISDRKKRGQTIHLNRIHLATIAWGIALTAYLALGRHTPIAGQAFMVATGTWVSLLVWDNRPKPADVEKAIAELPAPRCQQALYDDNYQVIRRCRLDPFHAGVCQNNHTTWWNNLVFPPNPRGETGGWNGLPMPKPADQRIRR